MEEAIGRSRYRDVSAVFKEAFGGYNLRGKKLPAQLQFLGGRLAPLDAFGRERAKEVVLLALARNQGQYIRSDSEVIIPVYPRAD